MTELEDIQRLIRLKRHEQPPEGFVDDFLVQLHRRQRSEMLRQSSLSLMWERISTYLEGRASPNMGLGVAAAVVALAGAAWWMPHGSAGDSTLAIKSAKPAIVVEPTSALVQADRSTSSMFIIPQLGFADQEHPTPPPARLGEMLLSEHFRGGYADEARANGITPVNGATSLNPEASFDVKEPPMRQNGSAEKIQKLGQ